MAGFSNYSGDSMQQYQKLNPSEIKQEVKVMVQRLRENQRQHHFRNGSKHPIARCDVKIFSRVVVAKTENINTKQKQKNLI